VATRLTATRLSESERERLAPGREGLNIEALCAAADGRTLYIGLRSPLAAGSRAIVIPLLNPDAIVERGETPRFGEPLLWHLGGSGLRDMIYSPSHGAYFAIAGASGDGRGFGLFRWGGKPEAQPTLARSLDSWGPAWRPEALVLLEGSSRLLVLSDDGDLAVPVSDRAACLKDEEAGSCPNKYLRDAERRTFKARWVDP
jgi:hypothetical protein